MYLEHSGLFSCFLLSGLGIRIVLALNESGTFFLLLIYFFVRDDWHYFFKGLIEFNNDTNFDGHFKILSIEGLVVYSC